MERNLSLQRFWRQTRNSYETGASNFTGLRAARRHAKWDVKRKGWLASARIHLLSEHAACYHACCGCFALGSFLMAEYNAMKHGSRVCAHESRDPLMAAPALISSSSDPVYQEGTTNSP